MGLRGVYGPKFVLGHFKALLGPPTPCPEVSCRQGKISTEKPWFNKSEGTKDFVLYIRDFVIAGFFTIKLTTKGLKIKIFTAGILLLKELFYRGFSVFNLPQIGLKTMIGQPLAIP
jgi:hypothetical protein